MKKHLFYSSILLIFLLSSYLIYKNTGNPLIRISNDCNIDFEEVIVRFPSQTENYGKLLSGSKSNYREIKRAYGYAYVKVKINGQEYILQPLDYVGDKLLKRGKYAYSLKIDLTKNDSRYNPLSLELVKD